MTRSSVRTCSYGPSASTAPDCSTVTRSASEPTTCMLWSTSTTVRPAGDPLDQGDGAVDVLDAHAGRRLVEEQQAGVEREGEGELEGPLLAVGE